MEKSMLQERTTWFREARFGMFIHWGLYSQLAGEWKGKTTTGGAEANPFKTHHDDFDLDVFFRISVGELWQKRLMAAGFEKTFEIGRVYRNEGSSPDHLQEFTNLEVYWAYAH